MSEVMLVTVTSRKHGVMTFKFQVMSLDRALEIAKENMPDWIEISIAVRRNHD